jgi:prolyl oligopeptidase
MNFMQSYRTGAILAASTFLLTACMGTMTGTSSMPEAGMQTSSEVAAGVRPLQSEPKIYPLTARSDTVDDYHGKKVADPYRWLEALDSPATRKWVEEQNAVSQPQLEAIPQRPWIKKRLAELWNYERYDVPEKYGSRYFYLRNDGKQNQSVLYVADTIDAEGRVLFDPNAVREDATIALSGVTPTPDGNVLGYALSDGGTDWQVWHFRSVKDGKDLPDTLRHTKFWGISWLRDGSGLYYSRYPLKPDGTADGSKQPAIYFHKMGDSQDKDQLVYQVTDHPTRVPAGEVTEDGRYLLITLFDGYERNAMYILDLKQAGSKVRPLFDQWDALYTFLGSRDHELYFHTTKDAPRGRVIAVDARNPAPASWRSVVAETDMALDVAETGYIGGRIIATYVKDARSIARLYERSGKLVGEVPLPGLGTIRGFGGKGKDPETFFAYTDYLKPAQIFRYDASKNNASVWRTPRIAASTDQYVTEQVFYTSKDGTRIPMFITHRRDMQRDGNQPVLLYGYGGFNVSMTPVFRPSVLVWLEMGGVYAEANLRGGGEYGEAWHQAGTRSKKQNVFDDFIAAAEYLINERYTRPSKLAIHGRSNGGLLTAAVLVQRPDLFGAALPAVGVLDMLRYHTASANARQWSSDYGLSENAEDFGALLAYSPVHNVKEGKCYPPTLITTADHDDRVVPWHSYKFAAALQHAQECSNPVLIRVETRAGHGAGKPIWMQIEDFADQWAFLAQHLGMQISRSPTQPRDDSVAVAGHMPTHEERIAKAGDRDAS